VKKPPEPRYLGDGVYAKFDGYHVWLLTGSHEASEADNKVALEPAVFRALAKFHADAWGEDDG
jgi:hypothetical protein